MSIIPTKEDRAYNRGYEDGKRAASPEARAGDCDAIADDDSIWTDLEILEASSRALQDSNPLMSVDIGHAVQNIVRRLTTKATP